MKISIIVPVYNTEEYIEECINSILNQKYLNWELILVNDGSTDNSGYICERYSQLFMHKIITINNKNQGPFLSRVCGVKYVTGDILMFLDSDDYLREDALLLINETFEKNSCDIVMYNAYIDDGCIKEMKGGINRTQVFESLTKKKLYELIICSSELNSMCLKAFLTDIFRIPTEIEKVSMIKHGEDLLQLMPLLTQARKIVNLNQNLYYYRKREGSLVHKFDRTRNESIKYVNNELERYIDIWEMNHLKPVFYAREVRSWLASLFLLLDNKKQFTKEEFKKEIKNLAEDDYFINALKKMDKSSLSTKDYWVAKWLYEKKYYMIKLLHIAREIKKWSKHAR